MQEIRVRSLGWEDSLGEGNGNPLQYSCLENPTGRGVWRATVHGITKTWTRTRDWAFIHCVWGIRIHTTGTILLHTFCNTGSNLVLNSWRLWVSVLGGVSKSSDSNLKGVLLTLNLEECTSQPEARPVDIYETPPVSRHWAGCWLCGSCEGRHDPFLCGVYNPVKKAAIEKWSPCPGVPWGQEGCLET